MNSCGERSDGSIVVKGGVDGVEDECITGACDDIVDEVEGGRLVVDVVVDVLGTGG